MNRHQGSNFDDFLKEEDIYTEVNEIVTKRAIAYQLHQELSFVVSSIDEVKRRIKKAEENADYLSEEEFEKEMDKRWHTNTITTKS